MNNSVNEKYSSLDADQIVATLDRLAMRIAARFPAAGLYKLCRHMQAIAERARGRSIYISRPNYTLRFLIALGILAVLGMAGSPFFILKMQKKEVTLLEFVQVAEPGLNIIVLIGATIAFLITIENRMKRRRALAAIHEIRSAAHIIDMHQLTKDPERLRSDAKVTDVSPVLNMSAVELSRYLDYCSEMLSLNGKIAALYIQHFDDPVAISSANDIEIMCTGLSRKIWQKIMMLQEHRDDALSHQKLETETSPTSKAVAPRKHVESE